jgi:hypothetical protein
VHVRARALADAQRLLPPSYGCLEHLVHTSLRALLEGW